MNWCCKECKRELVARYQAKRFKCFGYKCNLSRVCKYCKNMCQSELSSPKRLHKFGRFWAFTFRFYHRTAFLDEFQAGLVQIVRMRFWRKTGFGFWCGMVQAEEKCIFVLILYYLLWHYLVVEKYRVAVRHGTAMLHG